MSDRVTVANGFAYLVEATLLDTETLSALAKREAKRKRRQFRRWEEEEEEEELEEEEEEEDDGYASLHLGNTMAWLPSGPCLVSLTFDIFVAFRTSLPSVTMLEKLCDSLWKSYTFAQNGSNFSLLTRMTRLKSKVGEGIREDERIWYDAYVHCVETYFLNANCQMKRPFDYLTWSFPQRKSWKADNVIVFTTKSYHTALHVLSRLMVLEKNPFKNVDVGKAEVVWSPPPFVLDRLVPWKARLASALYFYRHFAQTVPTNNGDCITWSIDECGVRNTNNADFVITPTLPGFLTDQVIHGFNPLMLKDLDLVSTNAPGHKMLKRWAEQSVYARPTFIIEAVQMEKTRFVFFRGLTVRRTTTETITKKRPRPEGDEGTDTTPKRPRIVSQQTKGPLDAFLAPKAFPFIPPPAPLQEKAAKSTNKKTLDSFFRKE